jgi:hypothetical protein
MIGPVPFTPPIYAASSGVCWQENCKVPTRRGQVHVLGQPFPGKMHLLAEKRTSPRTLQFS